MKTLEQIAAYHESLPGCLLNPKRQRIHLATADAIRELIERQNDPETKGYESAATLKAAQKTREGLEACE